MLPLRRLLHGVARIGSLTAGHVRRAKGMHDDVVSHMPGVDMLGVVHKEDIAPPLTGGPRGPQLAEPRLDSNIDIASFLFLFFCFVLFFL